MENSKTGSMKKKYTVTLTEISHDTEYGSGKSEEEAYESAIQSSVGEDPSHLKIKIVSEDGTEISENEWDIDNYYRRISSDLNEAGMISRAKIVDGMKTKLTLHKPIGDETNTSEYVNTNSSDAVSPKEYSVTIEKTVSKTIMITAASAKEAQSLATEKYHNGDITVDSENCTGKRISIISEAGKTSWFEYEK